VRPDALSKWRPTFAKIAPNGKMFGVWITQVYLWPKVKRDWLQNYSPCPKGRPLAAIKSSPTEKKLPNQVTPIGKTN